LTQGCEHQKAEFDSGIKMTNKQPYRKYQQFRFDLANIVHGLLKSRKSMRMCGVHEVTKLGNHHSKSQKMTPAFCASLRLEHDNCDDQVRHRPFLLTE
jgi:hypothetical protein